MKKKKFSKEHMKFRDSRQITFVTLTGLYLLSQKISFPTSIVINGQNVRLDEIYQAKLNEKYTLVLPSISNFEGTCCKKFQDTGISFLFVVVLYQLLNQ